MASGQGSFAKGVLMVWNLFLLAIAISLILVGTRKFLLPGEVIGTPADTFLGIPLRAFSTGLIVVGAILGTLAMVGLNAAFCESSFLLKVYVYCLAFLATFLVGLLACSSFNEELFTEKGRTLFSELIEKSTQKKADSAMAAMVVDKWQTLAMCCGESSPGDWHNAIPIINGTLLNVTTNSSYGVYPASCCGKVPQKTQQGNVTVQMTCLAEELLYRDGCFSGVLVAWYKTSSLVISGAVISFLLLLIALSCCLERDGQLADSDLVNEQYNAHLDTCMGPNRFASGSKSGTRRLGASRRLPIRGNPSNSLSGAGQGAIPCTTWQYDGVTPGPSYY